MWTFSNRFSVPQYIKTLSEHTTCPLATAFLERIYINSELVAAEEKMKEISPKSSTYNRLVYAKSFLEMQELLPKVSDETPQYPPSKMLWLVNTQRLLIRKLMKEGSSTTQAKIVLDILYERYYDMMLSNHRIVAEKSKTSETYLSDIEYIMRNNRESLRDYFPPG